MKKNYRLAIGNIFLTYVFINLFSFYNENCYNVIYILQSISDNYIVWKLVNKD